jgi:acyl carrier protein
MEEDIMKKITEFIVENFLFGVSDDAPPPDQSFLETGYIDSTAMLELISFIEDEFGIELANDELVPANLDSLERINAFVNRKLAEAR